MREFGGINGDLAGHFLQSCERNVVLVLAAMRLAGTCLRFFEFLSEEKQNDFYNWRQGTRKDSVCDEIVGKTYFGTEENKRLIHRSESIEKSRSV